MDFPKGLLLDPKFRAGYGRLARYALSFDALLYHTQLLELADLARAFPDVPIILNPHRLSARHRRLRRQAR